MNHPGSVGSKGGFRAEGGVGFPLDKTGITKMMPFGERFSHGGREMETSPILVGFSLLLG